MQVVITSNVGGRHLNQYVLDSMKSGNVLNRDSITYQEAIEALNTSEDSVPCYRNLAKQDIPIKIVPFLPLARGHVLKCIEHEFRAHGYRATEAETGRILDDVGFFSEDFPVLSATGCKLIASKVDMVIGGKTDPYLNS